MLQATDLCDFCVTSL